MQVITPERILEISHGMKVKNLWGEMVKISPDGDGLIPGYVMELVLENGEYYWVPSMKFENVSTAIVTEDFNR